MKIEKFEDIKDFGFKNQICRAAVSISNNIAEGFDRFQMLTSLNFYTLTYDLPAAGRLTTL